MTDTVLNQQFNHEQFESILLELAAAGICVSFCFGQTRDCGVRWSVTCMSSEAVEFVEFANPFAANSLMHCAEIARVECRERGWVQ